MRRSTRWESPNQRESFAVIAAVVMHLGTASLCQREIDGVSKPFEYAYDRDSSLWEQSVVIAGYEERDAQQDS